MKRLKIIFFFKSDRRIRQGSPGYPEDLLYGYSQIGKDHDVSILEQSDFTDWTPNSMIEKWACFWAWWIFRIKLDHIYRYRLPENLERLNAGDVVIVTSLTQGVTLSLLRHWKILKPQVVFCATSLANHTRSPFFWMLMRKACRSVCMSSLSKGEITALEEKLNLPVAYYIFGTEPGFWGPGSAINQDNPFVLAVGNDPKRDYELLIRAWKPEYPKLKLVTGSRLPKTIPSNVERVVSNWHMGDASSHETQAEALRRLYQEALFVVTPLRQTFQPSGQSVALQALVCEKGLIMGDIGGIWDRDIIQHNRNCLLYRPGNLTSLQREIERLLNSPADARRLGLQGRNDVLENYTLEHTADSLRSILESHFNGKTQ